MFLFESHIVDICILVTKNIKLINSNLFKFLSNKFMTSIFLSYPSIYQILIANGNDFSVQKGSLIPANLRRLAMAMANQGFFSATRKGRIQGFLGRGEGREWSANCSPKICQSECKSLRNLHFEQISFN